MHHRAKKLFSFRVSCADSRLPKSHRMPRAKNVPFGNPLLQTSRGSFYAHFSLFPPVQKSNLTRVLTDKRNIISCFICLYRCSYSLDREIIGEADNKCGIGAESPPIAYRKNLMTIFTWQFILNIQITAIFVQKIRLYRICNFIVKRI